MVVDGPTLADGQLRPLLDVLHLLTEIGLQAAWMLVLQDSDG